MKRIALSLILTLVMVISLFTVFAVSTAADTPNTNAKYKVQHLLMTRDGEKVYKAYATYTFTGTTGELTNASAMKITGYTAREVEQLEIAADGSTIVKIKYDPNTNTKYKVQHQLMNRAGDKVYKAYATYTFTGTTRTKTKAVALNIPGYVAKEFVQETIQPDGTTMVKIYYIVAPTEH